MRNRFGLDFYRHMRIRNKLSLLIALIVALSFAAFRQVSRSRQRRANPAI